MTNDITCNGQLFCFYPLQLYIPHRTGCPASGNVTKRRHDYLTDAFLVTFENRQCTGTHRSEIKRFSSRAPTAGGGWGWLHVYSAVDRPSNRRLFWGRWVEVWKVYSEDCAKKWSFRSGIKGLDGPSRLMARYNFTTTRQNDYPNNHPFSFIATAIDSPSFRRRRRQDI